MRGINARALGSSQVADWFPPQVGVGGGGGGGVISHYGDWIPPATLSGNYTGGADVTVAATVQVVGFRHYHIAAMATSMKATIWQWNVSTWDVLAQSVYDGVDDTWTESLITPVDLEVGESYRIGYYNTAGVQQSSGADRNPTPTHGGRIRMTAQRYYSGDGIPATSWNGFYFTDLLVSAD